MNDKRVERLWRREGLKALQTQRKKGRLWLGDGSCVRLKHEYPNYVWSYDSAHHRTDDGGVFRTLSVIDEHWREALMIRVRRKLNSVDVIDVLTVRFILRGVPKNIRSDNGPEFIAEAVRRWINAVGAQTAYIAPGSPKRMDISKVSTEKCVTASEWRDFLHAQRSTNPHRTVAHPL